MKPSNSQPASEACSTASAGLAALRWIAEPDRAGWWWFASARETTTDLVRVYEAKPGGFYFRMFGLANAYWVKEREGRWSGPVELPKSPYDTTPPNARVSDSPGETST